MLVHGLDTYRIHCSAYFATGVQLLHPGAHVFRVSAPDTCRISCCAYIATGVQMLHPGASTV